jgi:hypothetical protein
MTLTHEEMVAILEQSARESNNAAARIAAIKALREIGDGKPANDAFAELDAARSKRNGS